MMHWGIRSYSYEPKERCATCASWRRSNDEASQGICLANKSKYTRFMNYCKKFMRKKDA